MGTKLIQLQDGIFVEVAVRPGEAQQVSGKAAEKVQENIEKIHPTLVRICGPIADAWKGAMKKMDIKEAEIQLGLSFEGEGNIYITKATAAANLTVKFVLKRE